MSLFNSDEMKYVGRLDYVCRTNNGCIVGESIQYKNQNDLIEDLKEDLNCGRPVCLILYKDKNGNVMPKDFVEDLDVMPAGYAEEEYDPNKNYNASER